MAQKLKQNAIFSFLVSKKKKKSACHCVWLSKISLLSPNVYVWKIKSCNIDVA